MFVHRRYVLAMREGDDVAVLVVGGNCGTGKEAEMLTSRPSRTRRVQGNQGNPWRWQQLSRPGMLRLGKEYNIHFFLIDYHGQCEQLSSSSNCTRLVRSCPRCALPILRSTDSVVLIFRMPRCSYLLGNPSRRIIGIFKTEGECK